MSDNVVKLFPQDEKKQRADRLRWLLLFAVLLLLIVLVLWFLLSRSTKLDGIKRFFRYLGRDDDFGRFSYDAYGQCSYTLIDNSFALATPNGLTLYDAAGEKTARLSFQLTAPALKANGDLLLLYDVGGTALYVYEDDGTACYALTLPAAIYDADLTEDGECSVLYTGSDCRAVLEVYGKDGKLRYRRKSKQQYLSSCALSPDAGAVALIALGQQETAFQSEVCIYPIDGSDADAALLLGDELPSALHYSDEEHLCAVGENSLFFLTQEGELLHSYRPENDALLFCRFGSDGYVSALYDTFSGQNRYRLLLFTPDGEAVAATSLQEPPLDVSTAGHYTAVLTENKLFIYDRSLGLCSSTDNAGYSHTLARTDGTALLFGDGAAVLFIPK